MRAHLGKEAAVECELETGRCSLHALVHKERRRWVFHLWAHTLCCNEGGRGDRKQVPRPLLPRVSSSPTGMACGVVEIRRELWKAYLGRELCSPVLWVPCQAGEHAVLQAPLGKLPGVASHPCTVFASICDSGHTVSFPDFFLLPGSS